MKINRAAAGEAGFWEDRLDGVVIDYDALDVGNYAEDIDFLVAEGVRKVLDLGCGVGGYSVAMARAGLSVTAVDSSSNAIEQLRGWAHKQGLSIETVVSPIQEYGAGEAVFDAVICRLVLDHLPLDDAQHALGLIHRALRPGGVAFLVFDGFEERDPAEYATLEDGTRLYLDGDYKGMLWRYYSDEEIRSLVGAFTLLSFSINRHGLRFVWLRK